MERGVVRSLSVGPVVMAVFTLQLELFEKKNGNIYGKFYFKRGKLVNLEMK